MSLSLRTLFILAVLLAAPSLVLATPASKRPRVIVVLSVDHGCASSVNGASVLADCGAQGFFSPPRRFQKEGTSVFREAEVSYDLLVRLKPHLERLGCEVVSAVRARAAAHNQPRNFGPRACPNDLVLLVDKDRVPVARDSSPALDARLAVGKRALARAKRLGVPVLWLSIHMQYVGDAGHRGAFMIVPGKRRASVTPLEWAFFETFSQYGWLRREKNGHGKLRWRDFNLERGDVLRVLRVERNPIPAKALIEFAHFSNALDAMRVRGPLGRERLAKVTAAFVGRWLAKVAPVPKRKPRKKPAAHPQRRTLPARAGKQPGPRPTPVEVSGSPPVSPKAASPEVAKSKTPVGSVAALCLPGRTAFPPLKPVMPASQSPLFRPYGGRARAAINRLISQRANRVIYGRPLAALRTWQQAVKPYHGLIRRAARRWDLPPDLVQAVVLLESGATPTARSRSEAVGLMQLKEGTAKLMGGLVIKGGLDWRLVPRLNIELGCAYLAWLADNYHGRLDLAVAAYHAGPGAIDGFLVDHLARRLARPVKWRELDELIDRYDLKLLDLLEDPVVAKAYGAYKDRSIDYAMKVAVVWQSQHLLFTNPTGAKHMVWRHHGVR